MDMDAWKWPALAVVVVTLLAIDLFAHRDGKQLSQRSALIWSGIWIGAGLAFNLFVWLTLGTQAAHEYLGAYLIEKSLSVDNIFLFLVIFSTLRIPEENQRRVLTLGILGALAFRALFIFAGLAAIERWSWMLIVFALLLLATAVRMALHGGKTDRESRLAQLLARWLPVTPTLVGHAFVIRERGRRLFTPLAVALIAIELSDILFAVDSVPAALAISRDPFVIYSSNAFAVLGLRSLYIVLARSIREFRYLHFGLAGVLAFAGIKMLLGDRLHVPPFVSVAIIATMVGASIVASRVADRHRARRLPPPHPA